MIASRNDSVLIEQVVYLASLARQATEQDPIFDMPRGRSQAKACPIQRALNLDCSVSGSTITFPTHEQADRVADALDLKLVAGKDSRTIMIPANHPFRAFVTRFDGNSSKYMRQLKIV